MATPLSRSVDPSNRIRRRENSLPAHVPVVLLAMLLVPFGAATLGWFNHDAGWFLSVAERWMGGEQLYTDILDVNPPLIVVLTSAVISLSRFVALDPVFGFTLFVMAAAVGSALFAAPAYEGGQRLKETKTTAAWGLLWIAFAVLVLPGADFGQREHLLVILSLPYCAVSSRRFSGAPVAAAAATTAGLLAGIGFSLKPHYLLGLAAVEGYLALSSARHRFLRRETLTIAGVGTTYLAAVLVFFPEYLALGRDVWPLYSIYFDRSWLHLATQVQTLAVGVGLVMLALAARRKRSDLVAPRVLRFESVSLSLAIGLLLAAFLQGKGWWNHLYPAAALSTIAIFPRIDTPDRRSQVAAVAAALFVASLANPLLRLLPVRNFTAGACRESSEEVKSAMWTTVERETAGGDALAVMDISLEGGFPLVNYAEATWGLDVPSLWFLVAAKSHCGGTLRECYAELSPDQQRAFDLLSDRVAENLRERRPPLVLVWGNAPDEDPARPVYRLVREYMATDEVADALEGYETETFADTSAACWMLRRGREQHD